MRLTALLFTR